jgi:carboxyl-terminal processing protease
MSCANRLATVGPAFHALNHMNLRGWAVLRTRLRPQVAAALAAMMLVSCAASATTTAGGARVTEANITRVTTALLEQSQFSHHPLDSQLAGKLLDRYLDDLDPGRSLFLQSDVAEMARDWGRVAGAMRDGGDTTAAHAIFARYKQRLAQRVAYGQALLRAPFDFTGTDRFVYDRRQAPRPRDLAEAQTLWRQQLRAEYLMEKLSKPGDTKPDEARGDAPGEAKPAVPSGDRAAEIVATLSRRLDRQLKTMSGLTNDEVVGIYLDALAHVYDPHSDYLGREEMESMAITMNLSLAGVGASLRDGEGGCEIAELIPGGPAAKSGQLKAGDRIVAVAQGTEAPVDVANMPLSRIVNLIRGPKGTMLTLTVLPALGQPGGARSVWLMRDEIHLSEQQAKARIIDLPRATGGTARLGLIDLPAFYAGPTGDGKNGATADLARLLAKLKAEGVRGVLLDLRRNGGGSLQEAIGVAGLFISKGPVAQTRDPGDSVEVQADADPSVAYDGPLVVLTSRFSASASEIVAGALQDYGRAVIVGDASTFGKGTVQNILPLKRIMDRMGLAHDGDPGALKVTISKFYRPSGGSTELRGVASHIVIPTSSEAADVGEAKLTDPLPWDTVPAARFDRVDRVAGTLPALRAGSQRRIAADPAFAELRQKIVAAKARVAAGSLSLNEVERRRELAAEEARDRIVDEAGRRAVAAHRTYEITLATAARPGLPAPTPPRAGAPGAGTGKRALADGLPGDELVTAEALAILRDLADQPRAGQAVAPAAGIRPST